MIHDTCDTYEVIHGATGLLWLEVFTTYHLLIDFCEFKYWLAGIVCELGHSRKETRPDQARPDQGTVTKLVNNFEKNIRMIALSVY